MQQINALNPQFQSKDLLIDLDMAQRLKKTGIPEAALLDYIQHAYQFAFEHNINLRQPHLIPDVEDEHAFIYILRDNNLTSEQRIQYDLKLAAHMLAYIKAHNNDYPYENVMFFIGRYKDKV
ncbi:hypothetical protein RO21_11160 [[Actinobacillus] muris]|uniref:Uncharacterized protein n=1 Tax=Muribacter muris TaxID=67855 RepID=A0A0J5P2R2_9PAST|nr:hypothetical protein [Muribacter muris]KMK50546.1 hypothetical protein RO21_11160 [[Actinobacillus] muris] [Muribacter muris]